MRKSSGLLLSNERRLQAIQRKRRSQLPSFRKEGNGRATMPQRKSALITFAAVVFLVLTTFLAASASFGRSWKNPSNVPAGGPDRILSSRQEKTRNLLFLLDSLHEHRQNDTFPSNSSLCTQTCQEVHEIFHETSLDSHDDDQSIIIYDLIRRHLEEEDLIEEVCDEESTIALPLWLTYIFIIILVMFSGLFSGLTLGLMGLDKTGLEIVMEGDSLKEAAAAKRIYPLRANGNLLLCTLLLGNVAVNSILSILTADIFGGTSGFLVSTAVIVIFGEIIPQAACSRYALQVGSITVPLVKVIIFIFYIFAAPLAFALDKILGRELATTYSKAELIKLLQIHVEGGEIDKETGVAMTGALNYRDLLVKNSMTPLSEVFMLDAEDRLNFDCIEKIFKAGYSRIPIYHITKNNIIGLLFVKDLIFIDPEDETPVKSLVQIFGRGANVVWPDDDLGMVLKELKKGRSHMALVKDVNNEDETQDPFYEIKGIITLEDIIEEIIGEEIVDETDAFIDVTRRISVNRDQHFDWSKLKLLDAKITDHLLSDDETKAVTAHLRQNYKNVVSFLSDKQLHFLVANTAVKEYLTATRIFGEELPRDLLYEKGVPSDEMTLVLSGKITVLVGADNFKSDISSWSVMAPNAMTEVDYVPDFSAFVSNGPCRCIVFTRDIFNDAVDASAMEKRSVPLSPFTNMTSVTDTKVPNSVASNRTSKVASVILPPAPPPLPSNKKKQLPPTSPSHKTTTTTTLEKNGMNKTDSVGSDLDALSISIAMTRSERHSLAEVLRAKRSTHTLVESIHGNKKLKLSQGQQVQQPKENNSVVDSESVSVS